MTYALAPSGPSLIIYSERDYLLLLLAGMGVGVGEEWGQDEGEGVDHGIKNKVWAHGLWSTATHLCAESI